MSVLFNILTILIVIEFVGGAPISHRIVRSTSDEDEKESTPVDVDEHSDDNENADKICYFSQPRINVDENLPRTKESTVSAVCAGRKRR
jgi:hypothetical protein